jgi:hypothetical protein
LSGRSDDRLQLMRHSLRGTAPTPPIIKTAMPHASEPVRSPYRMLATVALAWLGMYVHNVADLPNLTLSSRENLLPGLVWLLLFALWWAMPGRSWPLILLLAWGMLNLVGGAATVLPLPALRHYTFHLLYTLTQLPLLGIVRHELRQLRSRNDGAA